MSCQNGIKLVAAAESNAASCRLVVAETREMLFALTDLNRNPAGDLEPALVMNLTEWVSRLACIQLDRVAQQMGGDRAGYFEDLYPQPQKRGGAHAD